MVKSAVPEQDPPNHKIDGGLPAAPSSTSKDGVFSIQQYKLTVTFKPHFSCLSQACNADSCQLNISVSTQILKPIDFVGNVHEIGDFFDNPPTPDEAVGPLRTNLLWPVPLLVGYLQDGAEDQGTTVKQIHLVVREVTLNPGPPDNKSTPVAEWPENGTKLNFSLQELIERRRRKMKDFQGYRQKKNNEYAQQKAQRLELRNGKKIESTLR